ncbi:MAG: selenocysteine-specific translation elongation factor [Anaerolineales bacterium]|jgi:selenocysteine-specific elongation factor
MRVLGTAGHVDHGKSALVQALTGINPDRLREEQERQMTIDLGFAWMELPDGESVGIVDVPGHRDFIENMLAGVGGIDAALFVVAADEGVMPQTREHLAILDLLDVQRGVVALTKADLVQDGDWLGLVREDVAELLSGTTLAEAPIVVVSAITGDGLEELVQALSEVLRISPVPADLGRPRLSLDRAFTIAGFGTVVTGTLLDGTFAVGQEIEVLPKGLRGRIRGLQTHKAKVEQAVPGSRVAMNISGIDLGQLVRGDVVIKPGSFSATALIDVRFRLLGEGEKPLKHDQRVKLFLGAAQRMARVRLLGVEQLRIGEEGWLQLALDAPVVAIRGDRFILRRPSPGATLGGGQIADPHPGKRHRRKNAEVLARLERQLRGTPVQRLAQSLDDLGPTPLVKAVRHSGLDGEEARKALEEILEQNGIVHLGEGSLDVDAEALVVGSQRWRQELERIAKALKGYHKAYPLRQGMSREELKSRLGMETRIFSAVMEGARQVGVVNAHGPMVFLPEHKVILTKEQSARLAKLMEMFDQAPQKPPSMKQCEGLVGEGLLRYLMESGKLVKVSGDVVFKRETYENFVKGVRALLEEHGTVKVAEVRDAMKTSRKYALALMEHLDDAGVTIREGDVRRLKKGK